MPTSWLFCKRQKPFALVAHTKVLDKEGFVLETVSFVSLDFRDRVQDFFLLRKFQLRYLPFKSCFLSGQGFCEFNLFKFIFVKVRFAAFSVNSLTTIMHGDEFEIVRSIISLDKILQIFPSCASKWNKTRFKMA